MSKEEITGGGPAKASWESLQQGALDHYEELATKAHHWSSFVPAAIKAYKDPNAPHPFLEWLDSEIEKCEYGKQHYDWHSHNTSLQCFKEAKEKFLTIYFATPPANERKIV